MKPWLSLCAFIPLVLMSGDAAVCPEMAYEDHNQTDYELSSLASIDGNAIDTQSGPVPTICIGLFRDSDHVLMATGQTDENGHFSIGKVRRGSYRLVAKGQGFCPANARIRIGRSASMGKHLLLQMRQSTPAAILKLSKAAGSRRDRRRMIKSYGRTANERK